MPIGQMKLRLRGTMSQGPRLSSNPGGLWPRVGTWLASETGRVPGGEPCGAGSQEQVWELTGALHVSVCVCVGVCGFTRACREGPYLGRAGVYRAGGASAATGLLPACSLRV